MKNVFVKRTLAFCLALALVVGLAPPLAPPMEAAQTPPPDSDFARETLKQKAMDAYLKLPLYFIANQGQRDESVAYYAQGNGHSIRNTRTPRRLALPK